MLLQKFRDKIRDICSPEFLGACCFSYLSQVIEWSPLATLSSLLAWLCLAAMVISTILEFKGEEE